MSIACSYCGRTHEHPDEVRRCWQTSTADPEPSRTVARDEVLLTDSSLRPPVALGRNLVVRRGATLPPAWRDAPRRRLDRRALGAPGSLVDELTAAAHAATAVVIELDEAVDLVVDPRRSPAEPIADPTYRLGATARFDLEELHHRVWANSIDLRDPDRPRWWLVEASHRLGAELIEPSTETPFGDISIAGIGPCWLDGGPARRQDPIGGIPVVHAVAIEHGSLLPPSVDAVVDGLAADQAAAVHHRGGAVRVIAPAGSGKTRVLTERARHLIRDWRLPATSICLVAFNKRAQLEMQARTADLPGLEVRTLNSLALAILNGSPPFAPRSARRVTIDEREVRAILADLVRPPRRRNTDPIAAWIDALGQIRLGLVDPETAESRAEGEVDGLSQVWPRYRAALERRGTIDFDGQIDAALSVLLNDPEARRVARRSCRMLLVDEFQDLTPAHVLLLRLIAGCGGSIFAVGDDDQTIYGYQGADPRWLIDFNEIAAGAADHPLEVNYRCPPDVVAIADRLLRHNIRRVPKVIRAGRVPGEDPRGGWSTRTGPDPVTDTVDAVRQGLDGGHRPEHIAVLSRVNTVLAPVRIALSQAGIPASGGPGLELLERPVVRSALAWLRLALGAMDPVSLADAIRRPSRSISPRAATWMTEQSDPSGLERLADRLRDERDATAVRGFIADLGGLRALIRDGASTAHVVDALDQDLGLSRSVAGLDATRRGANRSAQGDDMTMMRHLALLCAEPSGFESWLRARLGERQQPNGVVLSTVHRVKGQQWPIVVVHLAAADQYPHRLADDDEEERRLFHVALTRAQEHVVVCTGPDPSPFVEELTREPPDPGVASADPGRGSPREPVRAAPVDSAATFDERQERLFEMLREMRTRRRGNKPAYTVFDDATLRAIAVAEPRSIRELLDVRGVGPVKAERYGAEILDLVAAVSAADTVDDSADDGG